MALASLGLIVSCSTSRKAHTEVKKSKGDMLPAVTEADAARGAEKFPGYTLAGLKQDMILYEQKCGACHDPKKPSMEPAEKWKGIVTEMVNKANNTYDKKISAAEQTAIMRYLTTMSTSKKK